MSFVGRAAAVLAAGWLMAAPPPARSQQWAADVYAGGTRYDALAGQLGATNLVANLRYQSRSGRTAYLSGAAPLDAGAALWGAGGLSAPLGRTFASVLRLGVELGGEGYAFDDRAGSTGGGAVLRALPFLRVSFGTAAVELRAGGHEHLFSFSDTSGSRGVFEVGARAEWSLGPALARVDYRSLSDPDGRYPYLGGQLATAGTGVRLWGWAGKWMAETLDDVEWGVGASAPVAWLGEVWAGVRRSGVDPLYLGSARVSWNVGVTRTFGGPRPTPPALLPRVERGAVRIRLPEALAGGEGAPFVAGEFSGWERLPMSREGAEWVLDLPLAAGVYRFAFLRAEGTWFVPEAYPGRIEDGFGGHVVLLVVP